LYTKLHLKSQKNVYYQTPILQTTTETASCQYNVSYVEMTGQYPSDVSGT